MGRLVTPPRAIVIAGPNGAGKTTAAPYLLRDEMRIRAYVNADVIAQGLDAERQRRLDLALARAFHAAVRLHRMHSLPLAVWNDGDVRHVDARDVRLPDDDATYPRKALALASR